MRTYMERARTLWQKYGRIRCDGRVYLAGEYIGRIIETEDGSIMSFRPRERRTGYTGVQPVALVCSHIFLS